jgi:hypothetical protein
MRRRILPAALILLLACRLPTEILDPATRLPPTTTPAPTWTPGATPTLLPTRTPEPTATAAPTAPPRPPGVIAPPRSAPPSFADPGRPALGGSVQYVDTLHFRIHYTLTGEHAAPALDADGNGVPDFVEEVALALEWSWHVEVRVLGWAAPPPDGLVGGDDRYDVYLENIYEEGISGYVDGGYEDTFAGDNPNSPQEETDASFSYMSLDNDFAENDEWGVPGISALDAMRATAAHELNHAIQFGYDGQEPADWLWEATATWIEELVYDEINDPDYYLAAVYGSPGTCQLAEGAEGADEELHWYGMWIFLRYISERHGDATVRAIWEYAARADGYDAIIAALAAAGTTVDEAFTGFAIALLLRDFEEGLQHPRVRLADALIVPGGGSDGTLTAAQGVEPMAVDYVQISAGGTIQVSLSGLRDGVVVGIREGQAELYHLREGNAVLNADAYELVYVLVLNLKLVNSENGCFAEGYTLTTAAADALPDLPDASQPAPNFRAP